MLRWNRIFLLAIAGFAMLLISYPPFIRMKVRQMLYG